MLHYAATFKVNMLNSPSIFVAIVSFNSASTIEACLKSLQGQEGYTLNQNLNVLVIDNFSTDNTVEVLNRVKIPGIEVVKNSENLGFSAGHNQALANFIKSTSDFYLCMNPDLALHNAALSSLSQSIILKEEVGVACPKLLRANENLQPLIPEILDAAGMYITPALRHFDRGSDQELNPKFDEPCLVFGASGACMLMKRKFVEDLQLSAGSTESDVDRIYPQLAAGRSERHLLFDEGFFAYREDADLCWRAQLFGWRFLYEPKALGYHVRKVTSENRKSLSANLNYLGVRNRFLLQLNQYRLSYGLIPFFIGYIARNFLVIVGTIFVERTSLKAFSDFIKLFRRGCARRKIIAKRAKLSARDVKKWFQFAPMTEAING